MHKLKLIRKRDSRETTEIRPRIYRDSDSISMEFPNGYVQSQMLTSDPNYLALSYTRAMIAFPVFYPKPARIAIIGLGGGSMVKWCYNHFPAAEITVIEINPHVISLREEFHIPADDDRLRVIHGDGADYVAGAVDSPEIVLVDGFDVNGQAPQLCSPEFYRNCYRALARDGLMVANLCGPDDEASIAGIRGAFSKRTIIAIPEDGENQIVFAFKGRRSRGESLPAAEIAGRMVEYVQVPVKVQSVGKEKPSLGG